jgi:hypothetical protein
MRIDCGNGPPAPGTSRAKRRRKPPAQAHSHALRQYLTVREAAFLLQRSEMQTRRMLEAGQLVTLADARTADGRRKRYVCKNSVVAALPAADVHVRRAVLAAILAGRFKVPAPATRWGAPVPLGAAVEALRG